MKHPTGADMRAMLLVANGEGDVRFRLLETMREFASERLEASGAAEEARAAHAAYFCSLVACAVPHLSGPVLPVRVPGRPRARLKAIPSPARRAATARASQEEAG